MALSPPTATTVRVASITASPEESIRDYFAMATDESNESLRSNQGPVLAVQDTLFARSKREARAGAKLVFWAEANAVVHTEHENVLIERGRALARNDHFTAQEPVMVSDVPTEGVPTIYSRIGDAFAWICVAALVWLAGGVVAGKW